MLILKNNQLHKCSSDFLIINWGILKGDYMKNLPLIKENIDLIRQGRKDNRGVRSVNYITHGNILTNNYNQTKQDYDSQKKIGEKFIFKIIKDSDKPINYHDLGLEVLATPNAKDVIVNVINPTALESKLTSFARGKIAKTKVVNYSDFANIDEFIFQTPEEKMGKLLSEEILLDDEEYILDVQLYVMENTLKEIHQNVTLFKKYLEKLNAIVIDDCILINLVIIKVKISGEKIQNLLEHKNVFVADFPQNSQYNIQGVSNYSFDQLPAVIEPADDSPIVGIIDSGIVSSHPLLKGSILDSHAFGDLDSDFDENGHGTMVAGIVQYGDVYNSLITAIESKTPLFLPFKLLNGRVTDKENKFPNQKIVASVVKEAIEKFVKEYNCSIFNVSLGDDRFPYSQNTKMDAWSFILDQLNHDYNLAIIVSSGNYQPLKNDESLLKLYIDYLLTDNDAAIIPPALAVSCITVGSIAKDDVPYNSSKKLNHVAIANKETISPFSRSGLGYSKSIKPETVSYGGNFSLNTHTKRLNMNDRNLGIFSTSIFNIALGSWFETRPGSSFAAPYITHLIANIKKEIPSAKGNLLRALLMNTSDENTITKRIIDSKYSATDKPNELTKKTQRLQGFGNIRKYLTTQSYDDYVTMFFEGTIGLNKVNVFEIPITEDIYIKPGKVKVNITLAYNPPVKDSRIDYTGIKMSYELYRGLSLEEIKKYTCKPDEDEFEKDKLPKSKKKCKCSLSPSMSDVKKGTILKASHEIAKSKRSMQEYGDTYYLVIKCQKRWYTGPLDFQEFAIAVSVEHENEKAQLYNQINQRVQSRLRNQARIRR